MSTVAVTIAGINVTDYANGYEVREESLTAGVVEWRRNLVSSPFAEGAYEAGAVLDLVEGAGLVIDVNAADQATLRTRVGTLLTAVKAASYTLSIALDGTAWTWTCMRANYSVGIATPDIRFGLVAPVTLTFPRQPTAVAGPY